MNNPSHLPLLALIGGATAIAFAPIFVRVSEVGPLATAFWRLLLAWPALWLWMALEKHQRPALRQPSGFADILRLAAAGFFFAGDLSLWRWSLRITPVANSTLLVNYAPIWVTFGSWWLFRERIEKIFLAGLVLATLFAWVLLHEGLGPWQVLGGLLVLMGIFLAR